MLDSLTRNIIYGTTYCALEHRGTDRDMSIAVLIAKKRKGELLLEERAVVSTVEDIKEHYDTLRYAHLIINNDLVLQKTVQITQKVPDTVIVNGAFPNIELDAFYYEIIRTEVTAYVYICRKAYIDGLIKTYEDQKLFITAWSLGSTALVSLFSLLEDVSEIQTVKTTLSLEKGKLTGIFPTIEREYQTRYYDVEGLKVEGDYVNALGAIVRIIGGTDDDLVTTNFNEREGEQQSHFKQHRIFAIGVPLTIGALLLIFLVNFLFYNHYYTEVTSLQEVGETNVLQKQLLIKKDSIVNQKQKLFEDVIESASSSSSYFLDEIIQEMPHTILLDGLQYHPLVKKIRKNKPVIVQENTIIITGTTTVNNDLSVWISTLEGLEFTESVSIKNLEKEGRNTTFGIELLIGS
ncbi:hypothetical protein [Dokdonia sp.]|uniref:hypothetical protein n=1 Tax=Dokdonia sp. TaxID=2024995 RepID=UPI003266EBDB